MNLNDLNRKEILKEFNQNYRTYLENNFIVNILTDLVINSQSKLIHSSSGSNFEKYDSTPEDKVRDTFLKTYFVLNNTDKTSDVLDEIKIEPLNFTSKEYLTRKFESKFDEYLGVIDEFFKFETTDQVNTKWQLDDTENDQDDDQILSKFNFLIESINEAESEITKLDGEMSIKFEHCLNISIEIIKLAKTILNDYKLKFYANKNEIECQRAILTCDLLLTKIETVHNEFLHDLYSPDKIKALGIVKNHIQMETLMAKEKFEQIEHSLKIFKSFGSEFDSIVKTYLNLRAKHESKTWTLNKLKEESNF